MAFKNIRNKKEVKKIKVIKIIKKNAPIQEDECKKIFADISKKLTGADYIFVFVGSKNSEMWQYTINSDNDIKRELMCTDNLSSINLADITNIQFVDLLKILNKEDWESLLGIGSEKC